MAESTERESAAASFSRAIRESGLIPLRERQVVALEKLAGAAEMIAGGMVVLGQIASNLEAFVQELRSYGRTEH